jgi:hypothetical protein
VGSPGILADLVLAPAGVASSPIFHFEDDKIPEAAAAQAPGGAQPGNSTTDDDEGNTLFAGRHGRECAVTKPVACFVGLKDERARYRPPALLAQSDERGTEEPAARRY